MSLPVGAGAGPQGQAPVCPRHPDRVSYVRCQRCDRPACPQCQRPAPVGIQCVDCVREASRAVDSPTTAFGARLRGGPPVVTITIIALCVLSYVLQTVTPDWEPDLWFTPVQARTEPYRFLTTAFLHGSVLHIAFNMYALWVFGPYLEAQLGRVRFIALYLVSAFAGSVGVLVTASPDQASWVTVSIGASGAVFGLFGAVAVVLRRLGGSETQMLVVIGANLVIGFVLPNIAWQAHLGGLVAGLLIGLGFAHAPRAARVPVAVAVTGGVALAAVLAAVLRYQGVA